MKEELLARLEQLGSAARSWDSPERDVMRWLDEIHILLELKRHGCQLVFDSMDIDEQIKDRYELIRSTNRHQSGQF
jgi:hypothetical protein